MKQRNSMVLDSATLNHVNSIPRTNLNHMFIKKCQRYKTSCKLVFLKLSLLIKLVDRNVKAWYKRGDTSCLLGKHNFVDYNRTCNKKKQTF